MCVCVWGGGGGGGGGGHKDSRWGEQYYHTCTATELGLRFTVSLVSSLVPRLLPNFLLHTVHETGREPGRSHHVHDDIPRRMYKGKGAMLISHVSGFLSTRLYSSHIIIQT